MSKPQPQPSVLDFVNTLPGNIKTELSNRHEELTRLEEEQLQEGTTVPQLYGSLSRFVANPSTVSVETYKRMIDTDETIGAGVDFLILALIARWGEYKHPVKKIEKFVRRALARMEGSWHENLDEMLSAEWAGFSTTEQVWEYLDDFDGAPAFVPKKIVTYPPLTLVFAVDRHGDILPDGIYQYQRFHNTFFNSWVYGDATSGRGNIDGFRPDLFASIGDYPYPIRIAADLTYLTVKIPKSKCIMLRSSVTGKFQNPYGRSILRRIYKNWVMKDAFLKMWLIGADRKGTPLTIGYAAPNDTVLEGEMNSDPYNVNARAQRADVAMAQIFKTIHNSSFIVLPGKKGEVYEVDAIQSQGDMNVFKDGVTYFNTAIMRGLLLPPLVLGGDGGGSFALGQEHNKIFKQTVDGKNKVYKQNVLDQFIRKIIAYNFPKGEWEKHGNGEFTIEDFDPETMEKLSQIYERMTNAGYMSQFDQVDMDEVRLKLNLKKKKTVEPPAQPTEDDSGEESSYDDKENQGEDTHEIDADKNPDLNEVKEKIPSEYSV
jgi:hypothetical protein